MVMMRGFKSLQEGVNVLAASRYLTGFMQRYWICCI